MTVTADGGPPLPAAPSGARAAALAIAHLMRRQATQAGLDLSVRELLHTLAGIGETVLIYPSTGGRPRARRMLTEQDPTQQRLFGLFDLATYAPRA